MLKYIWTPAVVAFKVMYIARLEMLEVKQQQQELQYTLIDVGNNIISLRISEEVIFSDVVLSCYPYDCTVYLDYSVKCSSFGAYVLTHLRQQVYTT